MRPQGSAHELAKRRRLAVARVNEGYSQTEVARFLGVHVRSVRDWMARYRRDGDEGLAAKPQPGRPRRLTPEQERTALGWLARDPAEFGFATELWTAPRVAQVLRRTFGVTFHPRYLNEWLTARGISPQKPQRVPRERDQAEVDRWVAEEWPRIKKTPGTSGPTSS